ncbi:hypothetical protein, partial [Novosphingobium sediminicola]
MGEMSAIAAGKIERFPPVENASAVSDELGKLLGMIKAACPEATAIHFDFDGKLRVRIDVHSRDDVAAIQKTLPALGGGGVSGIPCTGRRLNIRPPWPERNDRRREQRT